jgi:hypothetical protein
MRPILRHVNQGWVVLTELRQRARELQLAGDGRAGSWARAKVRRRQWQFVRRQWRFFAATVVAAAAITCGLLFFIRSEFLRGLLVGASLAGTVGALAILVMLVTGGALISMGAMAEQWTAGELRPLKRQGWRVINHVALNTWDIDHVLVGPAGLIVVETKWSSHGWQLNQPKSELTRAIEQARANARSLRLWHEVHSLGIESVGAVLFLWGSDQDEHQPIESIPRQMGEVTVINGTQAARAWRTSLQLRHEQTHEPDQVRKLWDALNKHITGRDKHDRAASPPPPTLARVYWTGVGVTVAAIVCFIIGLQTLRVGSLRIWLLAGLLLASIGVAARRVKALRLPALGWFGGLGAVVVLLIVAALHAIT